MYCVAFANDNERLLAAGDQGEVGLWKFRGTPTLELSFPLEHRYDTVIALDVSPANRKFLVRTRYDSTIAVWEYLDKNFHERILIEKDDAAQTTQ